MLSRLVVQAARPALAQTMASAAIRRPAPLALASSLLATRSWTRGMAKDNKPRPRFGAPPPGYSQDSPKAPSQRPLDNAAPSRQANPQQPPPSQAEPESQGTSAATDPLSSSDAEPFGRQSESPEKAAEGKEGEQSIPFHSLPDLTQGLPSTLEYETAGASKASRMALEGVTSASGRGKGELPASAYISSSERRRQRLANWLFALFGGGAVVSTIYLGRNWDEDELQIPSHADVPNGWGLGLWWNRASTRTREMLSYYQEPAAEKLLPDSEPPFERPYTLCISLEDMLVHSEWTREHGWRVAKRPGMDYFIRYLQQYYEIVLFTTVPWSFGEPLWRKIEPYHIVIFSLFREATKYKDGKIVKDLSYLNRDLSKVIILDTNPDSVSAQPENAIVLPKWKGDPKDTDLVSLIPFLEYIATMNLPDTREVLKSFHGKPIPEEFARREALARKRFQAQLEAEKAKHPHRGKSMFGSLGGAFGLKPSKMASPMAGQLEGEESVAEAFAQGKMLQDIARERGQKNYEFLEKQIREHGAEWLKDEQEQMEKLQAEAAASMKDSFAGWFRPKPEEGAKKEAETKVAPASAPALAASSLNEADGKKGS